MVQEGQNAVGLVLKRRASSLRESISYIPSTAIQVEGPSSLSFTQEVALAQRHYILSIISSTLVYWTVNSSQTGYSIVDTVAGRPG